MKNILDSYTIWRYNTNMPRRKETVKLNEPQLARRIQGPDRELFTDFGCEAFLQFLEGKSYKTMQTKLLKVRDYILLKQENPKTYINNRGWIVTPKTTMINNENSEKQSRYV